MEFTNHMGPLLLVLRDLAHLVWFVAPLVLISIATQMDSNEDRNQASFFGTVGLILQFLLAVGYCYGWNVL